MQMENRKDSLSEKCNDSSSDNDEELFTRRSATLAPSSVKQNNNTSKHEISLNGHKYYTPSEHKEEEENRIFVNINNNNNKFSAGGNGDDENNINKSNEHIIDIVEKEISTEIESVDHSSDIRGSVYRHIYNAKLHDSVNHIIDTLTVQLPADHVLQQLLSDHVTAQYVKLRIGEVVEGVLYSAQAAQYHSLTGLLAESELQRVELAHQVSLLESKINNINNNMEMELERKRIQEQRNFNESLLEQLEYKKIRENGQDSHDLKMREYNKELSKRDDNNNAENNSNVQDSSARDLLLSYLLSSDTLRNELSNAHQAQEIMQSLTSLINTECQLTTKITAERNVDEQKHENDDDDDQVNGYKSNNNADVLNYQLINKDDNHEQLEEQNSDYINNNNKMFNAQIALPSITTKVISHLFRTIYLFVEHLASSLHNALQLRREVHEHSSIEYCQGVLDHYKKNGHVNKNNITENEGIMINDGLDGTYENTIAAYATVQGQLHQLESTLRESENQLIAFVQEKHEMELKTWIHIVHNNVHNKMQELENKYKTELKDCEEQHTKLNIAFMQKQHDIDDLQAHSLNLQKKVSELQRQLNLQEKELIKKQHEKYKQLEEERAQQQERLETELYESKVVVKELRSQSNALYERLSECELENLCNVVELICKECELRYYEMINKKQALLIAHGYEILVQEFCTNYDDLVIKLQHIEWNVQQNEISLNEQEENEEYFNHKLAEFAALMHRTSTRLSHKMYLVSSEEEEQEERLKIESQEEKAFESKYDSQNDKNNSTYELEPKKDEVGQSLHELFLSLHNSFALWQNHSHTLVNECSTLHKRTQEQDEELYTIRKHKQELIAQLKSSEDKVFECDVRLQQERTLREREKAQVEEKLHNAQASEREMQRVIQMLKAELCRVRTEQRTLNEQLITLEHVNADLHIRCTNAEYERSKLQRLVSLHESSSRNLESNFVSTPVQNK